jgi:hypothetical protein
MSIMIRDTCWDKVAVPTGLVFRDLPGTEAPGYWHASVQDLSPEQLTYATFTPLPPIRQPSVLV